MLRQVVTLTKEEKEQLLQLTAQEKTGSLLLRIVANNCITIDDTHFGVFLLISRINHSCWPNCLDSSFTSEGQRAKEVVLVRDVRKGEEITLSYLTCNMGTAALRSVLCNCGISVKRLLHYLSYVPSSLMLSELLSSSTGAFPADVSSAVLCRAGKIRSGPSWWSCRSR